MVGIGALPGGIATVSRTLAQGLVRVETGRQLEVLSLLDRPADRPAWLPAAVAFEGFAGSRLAFAIALIGSALRRRRLVFDHVTLALPVLPLMALGWTEAAILAHGSESWRRIRRSSRWIFRFASVVMANSRYTEQRMRDCGVRGKIVACPLGLAMDVRLNDSIPGPVQSELSLGAVDGQVRALSPHAFLLAGRMLASEREKGHDQLLVALPRVRQRHADAQLVFAGTGDDIDRLASRARELGIGDAVFIPGFVLRDRLEQLYGAACAFTMPSRQEGFGLAFLEAMNHGKACLGCRNDGAADVIVAGETGVLIDDPDDAAALADDLCKLIEDSERTARMGQAGFRRLHAEFTTEHYQERALAVLREHLS